jgi:hypothetical protein
MSRKKHSTFEDLIDAASFRPWCLAQLYLVASYFLFQYLSFVTIPPSICIDQMSDMMRKQALKSFSMLLQYIAPKLEAIERLSDELSMQLKRSEKNKKSILVSAYSGRFYE